MSVQDARFLVVDDSSVTRRTLVTQLRELGFIMIEEAENGQVGLRKLQDSFLNKTPFNVVITDLQMPQMSGSEFIKKIRENPEYNGIAVLIVSIETDKGAVILAVKKGADGYILKPTNTAVLKEKLDKILAKNTKPH